jgi:ubiquitin carboxyl-terminal hydrolase 7
MAQRVGDYLKHDPLRLRFTSSNTNNLGPKAVIKRALNQSVGDLTQTGYYGNHPTNVVLYYERLDVSIVELETKKSLKITWTGSHNKEEVSHTCGEIEESSVFTISTIVNTSFLAT